MVTFSARKEELSVVGVKGLNPRQINKRPFFIFSNLGVFSFGVPKIWQKAKLNCLNFHFIHSYLFIRILFTFVTGLFEIL
jgi:hypothetical protein